MIFSIIIPAKNEAEFIADCLTYIKNSLKLCTESYEIIVVSDNSKDNTSNIANTFGCETFSVNFDSRSKTRNFGASKAKGDIITFIDADTFVDTNFFSKTLKQINNENNVLWYKQNAIEKTLLSNFYFLIFNFILNFRPLFSPVISIRRSCFKRLYRFNENLLSFEDFYFLNKAWKNGIANLCNSKVSTSIRRVSKFGLFKSIVYFVKACIDPFNYPWRPIND